MSQPVLVQGAGSWGTALALVLARNNHQVYLWDIDSDVIEDIKLRRHNARYLPEIEIPKNLYPIVTKGGVVAFDDYHNHQVHDDQLKKS